MSCLRISPQYLTYTRPFRSSLVRKHLLAFRWANPNALVYLHEHRVPAAKTAFVSYELCTFSR